MKIALPNGKFKTLFPSKGLKRRPVAKGFMRSLEADADRRYQTSLKEGSLSRHDTDWSLVAHQIVGKEDDSK